MTYLTSRRSRMWRIMWTSKPAPDEAALSPRAGHASLTTRTVARVGSDGYTRRRRHHSARAPPPPRRSPRATDRPSNGRRRVARAGTADAAAAGGTDAVAVRVGAGVVAEAVTRSAARAGTPRPCRSDCSGRHRPSDSPVTRYAKRYAKPSRSPGVPDAGGPRSRRGRPAPGPRRRFSEAFVVAVPAVTSPAWRS